MYFFCDFTMIDTFRIYYRKISKKDINISLQAPPHTTLSHKGARLRELNNLFGPYT